MTNILLFVSGGELILVGLLALLFFGADSIPEIARMMGKGMREFKKATNDIKREFDEQTSDIKKDINEIQHNVKRESDQINRKIEDELNK